MVEPGDIVVGSVRRIDGHDVIVDVNGFEAWLPKREQVQGEVYRLGDRMIMHVVEAVMTPAGSRTIVSRASKDLLERLLEMEAPEIHQKQVRIEACAREPGVQSKVAVASERDDVDPVAACIGENGSRAEAVRRELRGERIDIFPWDANPARFVCSAMAPAEVSRVIIDTTTHTLQVSVDDDQLSMAVGKNGLNLRLASLVTDWNIEIKLAKR